MARQIAPGNPQKIGANQFKVDLPDFSKLEDMGDAQIKAANTNFTLYATTLIQTESAKLYEQYKNDPIQLSNALGKLPKMLTGLPDEIQDEMNRKLYLNGISLVQKAQNNQLVAQDLQNQKLAADSINTSKALMAQEYQNILQNHISKAEDKSEVSNEIFLEQQMNLNNIADLQDHSGKNVYSETQRKAIRNTDDLKLAGFKQFFDTMVLNDNDELEQSKDYYTKFILAPERFMSENYMNRETYDKARTYAEKELKRAGVEIKKARFNQSIKEAMQLQIEDLPEKIESLNEAGLIDKKIIKNIENTNVKFNKIDPSKAESPIAMLNLLQIVNQQKYNPAPTNEAEQQAVLEQGTATLDSVADYAQTYGLSPKNVQIIREAVVNQETDAAFRPILNNFSDIIDNFNSKLSTVRNISTGKGGISTAFKSLTGIDGMSNEEAMKLIKLNNVLAIATDTINQQIRAGDWDGVRQTQKDVQKQAARIKYDDFDWSSADNNPDAPVEYKGRKVKFKNYTLDGDVIFEIVE